MPCMQTQRAMLTRFYNATSGVVTVTSADAVTLNATSMFAPAPAGPAHKAKAGVAANFTLVLPAGQTWAAYFRLSWASSTSISQYLTSTAALAPAPAPAPGASVAVSAAAAAAASQSTSTAQSAGVLASLILQQPW